MKSRINTALVLALALGSATLACGSRAPEGTEAPSDSVAQAATSTLVSHSNWSGASASASSSGELSSGYVNVWEEKTSKARKAAWRQAHGGS